MDRTRTVIGLILLAVGVFFLAARDVQADTWYVSTNGVETALGTNGWANALFSISNAVARSKANDTVLVSNGTYKLTTAIAIAKGITVQSVNGKDATIVDGNATNRCFTLTSASAIVDGFTMTNGLINQYGGGVYMYPGIVRNCTISGNMAVNIPSGGYGGGAYLNDSRSILSNCTVSGNVVSWLGGGVAMANGAVQNCIISGNRATNSADGNGGGVYMTGGILESNCLISGNTVAWYGSGVYVGGGLVRNCVISNNTATSRGGGITFNSGNGTVQDCTIINNWSLDWGGGVDFWSTAKGTLSNCLVAGNTALSGGGIYMYGGNTCLVYNCDIAGNKATSGGGIAFNGTLQLVKNCRIHGNGATNGAGGGVSAGNFTWAVLQDCLIDGNTATTYGGGLNVNEVIIQNCTIVSNACNTNTAYSGGGIRFGNTNNVVVNTIIWGNTGGGAGYSNYVVSQPTFFTNCCFAPALTGLSTNYATNNTTLDPQYVDSTNGNYRLKQTSPCRDTGLYDASWMDSAVDLDTNRRAIYGRVDMGCYQHQPPPQGSLIYIR